MKRHRRAPLLARHLLPRIEDLEAFSHEPFDFAHLIARLAKLEREVKRLKGSVPSKRKVRSRS